MPKSSSTRENLTSRVDKINKSEEIANLRAKTKAVENVLEKIKNCDKYIKFHALYYANKKVERMFYTE